MISLVSIFGEALTLFSTAPLIPIEAFARAYSFQSFLSSSVACRESFPFRQKMEVLHSHSMVHQDY
jgi:hypothetical protein